MAPCLFHASYVYMSAWDHEMFFFLQGDQKLDYNAEMYHYHQTKSQLAAMEK